MSSDRALHPAIQIASQEQLGNDCGKFRRLCSIVPVVKNRTGDNGKLHRVTILRDDVDDVYLATVVPLHPFSQRVGRRVWQTVYKEFAAIEKLKLREKFWNVHSI